MSNSTNTEKLTIFLTGGTSGLGRLAAKKCLDLGHVVIITGRSETSLETARKIITEDCPQNNNNLYGIPLNLIDVCSIKKAVETFASLNLPAIDVLVNNAGGINDKLHQIVDKVEGTVFMNAIGPIYLTNLLMPYIGKSTSSYKRVVFVSSGLHDPSYPGGSRTEDDKIPQDVEIADLSGAIGTAEWNPMKFYKISKLAVMWGVYGFAEKHPDLPVFAVCPGFVPTTDLSRNSNWFSKLLMKYVLPYMSFTTSEKVATDDYVYYITSNDVKTGTYYQKRAASKSSPDSLNKVKQEAYWDFATNIINELTK